MILRLPGDGNYAGSAHHRACSLACLQGWAVAAMVMNAPLLWLTIAVKQVNSFPIISDPPMVKKTAPTKSIA